jgi:16S rRNA (cytidine1402-2'-O)-methyltransferase
MSQRAIEVLRNVDLIAAEDTRHSRRLQDAFAIDTATMAYHDHSDARALGRIRDCLAGGGSVALVSDAGTPLISDPGYRLVRLAQEEGFPVHPVPGPCAAVAALSVSGLPTDRFFFEGFLPAREAARRRRLDELATGAATLVFYEAPHRVQACLADMVELLGPGREAVLARELTKTFETLKRATLAELAAFVAADEHQRRGEIVLLVAGRVAPRDELDAEVAGLLMLLARELPLRRAAAVVAEHTGLRKNALYQYLLDNREQEQ